MVKDGLQSTGLLLLRLSVRSRDRNKGDGCGDGKIVSVVGSSVEGPQRNRLTPLTPNRSSVKNGDETRRRVSTVSTRRPWNLCLKSVFESLSTPLVVYKNTRMEDVNGACLEYLYVTFFYKEYDVSSL